MRPLAMEPWAVVTLCYNSLCAPFYFCASALCQRRPVTSCHTVLPFIWGNDSHDRKSFGGIHMAALNSGDISWMLVFFGTRSSDDAGTSVFLRRSCPAKEYNQHADVVHQHHGRGVFAMGPDRIFSVLCRGPERNHRYAQGLRSSRESTRFRGRTRRRSRTCCLPSSR